MKQLYSIILTAMALLAAEIQEIHRTIQSMAGIPLLLAALKSQSPQSAPKTLLLSHQSLLCQVNLPSLAIFSVRPANTVCC